MYTAHYEREPDKLSWFVHIPELYLATRAFHVEDIEDLVRGLVATTLDVDADAFDVQLIPQTLTA